MSDSSGASNVAYESHLQVCPDVTCSMEVPDTLRLHFISLCLCLD